MSKIGKQPIKIPAGIAVNLNDHDIVLKSEKGQLTIPILDSVNVEISIDEIKCLLTFESNQARSNWGTTRALIANAIMGLTSGFQKILILEGVGYRISKEGNDLVLSLGFSHPVRYKAPTGIIFEVENNTTLKVTGIDKAIVGQVAAEIRTLKKPEPYKGKGFHYQNEVVRRKAGKKATTSGT